MLRMKLPTLDFNQKVILITSAVLFTIGLSVIGISVGVRGLTDWGATHRIVKQPIVAEMLRLQLPYKVETIEPKVITIIPEVITRGEPLKPIEQKIIDKWGIKEGVIALAIFDCGESGLDQYAVSHTGDLGIAQINWRTWKQPVVERFNYNAADMFDIDKNLEVAYMIWDKGDRVEGNQVGSFTDWVGFTSGGYTRCFK